ncbi:hypothetical protein INT47_002696 [Mucor saturninus]|uniref:Palmitoyltransferase n=1 Tax=Mucor saturninus TaxID=64648 RepID=A0A8H7UXP8_9FUNG|nr:hypothetical protein INT47_002696 [Mucor saturninus]
MPLPKGKKPGQHRDWGLLPIVMVCGLASFVYYGIVSQKPGHPNATQMKPFSILGESKWCDVCQLWKPDRTHHCRVCGACVLKMDHHCPWVNGCVGISNYRFYVQFLCYVTLLGTWIFTTSLAAFIQFNGLSTFDGIALSILIIGGIITFILGAFTMSHLWLILKNQTTIENSQFQKWKREKLSGNTRLIPMFTESGKNVFDRGYRQNWLEVMGSNRLLWFLPLMSKQGTDGVHFGHSSQTLKEYQDEDGSRRIKAQMSAK